MSAMIWTVLLIGLAALVTAVTGVVMAARHYNRSHRQVVTDDRLWRTMLGNEGLDPRLKKALLDRAVQAGPGLGEESLRPAEAEAAEPPSAQDRPGRLERDLDKGFERLLDAWLEIEALAAIGREDLHGLAARLAFVSLETSGSEALSEAALLDGLQALAGGELDRQALRRDLAARPGPMIPAVGGWRFAGGRMREYLAACHLTAHEYPEKLAALALAEPERWCAVLLLAGAKAARGTAAAVWLLADELCPGEIDAEAGARERGGLLLAAELLAATVVPGPLSHRNQAVLERVRHGLQALVKDAVLDGEILEPARAWLGVLEGLAG